MASTQSTITLQNVADRLAGIVDIAPILSVGGFSNLTMLTIATDVMNALCAQSFPWKWNEIELPVFCTNSWQQDYAILYPSGSTLTNLASLQRGIAVDINNDSVPKPWGWVEIVREQMQSPGTWWYSPSPYFRQPLFQANWMLNSQLYYGTWGATNLDGDFGNNPVAGSVYTDPIGAASQPENPITQIEDANGNLLVLTTYGEEGTGAPLAAANAAPGTTVSGSGATTVWTVVDPNGQGIRISPTPSGTGTVWQFNLTGQQKPVAFSSLAQTLFPLPDWMEPHFRQGCTAQAYRYSEREKISNKFDKEWTLWIASTLQMREKSDKERDAQRFVLSRTVLGAGGSGAGWVGPAWPFAGPPR